MDFFKYAIVAEMFAPNQLWAQLLIGALCFAIVFIFEAIALFTIATKNGYKNKWMAFIPFLNTYYIGVCAQKNKFYNIDSRTIGLVAAIFEALLVGLFIFSMVAGSLVEDYLVEVEDTYYFWTEITYQVNTDALPDNLRWAAWVYTYMSRYILNVLNFVYDILIIILLICFFQTYACRRYVLFAITSILFPIMGILFFIVRNNKAINYKDFIRAEQARQYQQYQQNRQNYNNPYNPNFDQNPYNRNPYNNPPSDGNGEDPFDEYGGNTNTHSDPFDDFDKH